MTDVQYSSFYLLAVAAFVILVILFRWKRRRERRFTAASEAFVAQQQHNALKIVDDIIDTLQSDCERRTAEIMLSAPERLRPYFLTILNEEIDDNGRYSKADFILAADAIFRTIALDWAADYAQRFPPDPTTSTPGTEESSRIARIQIRRG